jgi:membrane protein implicated in regulation of membrane protease activity
MIRTATFTIAAIFAGGALAIVGDLAGPVAGSVAAFLVFLFSLAALLLARPAANRKRRPNRFSLFARGCANSNRPHVDGHKGTK